MPVRVIDPAPATFAKLAIRPGHERCLSSGTVTVAPNRGLDPRGDLFLNSIL